MEVTDALTDVQEVNLDSRNAWRVMLVNPLDSSPLGQVFVTLEKSGLVAAWLPKPELSGVASTLANR